MFRRLRETVSILTAPSRPSPGQQNLFDNYRFAHTEESEDSGNQGIVRLIDAVVFAAIAMGVGNLINAVKQDLSAAWVGAATATITVVSFKFIHPLIEGLVRDLKLGMRLSPYFGHKIAQTKRILNS